MIVAQCADEYSVTSVFIKRSNYCEPITDYDESTVFLVLSSIHFFLYPAQGYLSGSSSRPFPLFLLLVLNISLYEHSLPEHRCSAPSF